MGAEKTSHSFETEFVLNPLVGFACRVEPGRCTALGSKSTAVEQSLSVHVCASTTIEKPMAIPLHEEKFAFGPAGC